MFRSKNRKRKLEKVHIGGQAYIKCSKDQIGKEDGFMTSTAIYQDIATRTGGDIYIGVVGPVRTGKSTFIKRFMETIVLPNMENTFQRERAKDELPQSGSGRTIMTVEPKFVPEEAVDIAMDDGGHFSMRLIDCVGYMVPGAMGQQEDGIPRMVHTPWFPEEIPMVEAAEIGTRKVIREHRGDTDHFTSAWKRLLQY